MSDYSELKVLAGAEALSEKPRRRVSRAEYDQAFQDFLEEASPAKVLALIAENERLTGFVVHRREQADQYDEALTKVADQRDKLKAENAHLKKQEIELKAENERLEEDRKRIRQQRMDYARKNDALHDQVGQLKAELESVQPYFEDVERLCKVLGYLGVSTPEGGEEQAARWLSLVRTMICTAETSKLLRHDAEKIAEYERIKAENDALGSAATAAASDLRKAADWICRKVEAGTESATHWAIRLGDNARALDAAMSKGERS